eukprot:jgi/Tetstr1/462729/TSEL_007692.t1
MADGVAEVAAMYASLSLDAIARPLCPLAEGASMAATAEAAARPLAEALRPALLSAGLPDSPLYDIVVPSFAFFASIYLLGHVFFALVGVRGAERALFASCVMSVVHGATTTLFSGAEICRLHPNIDYGMKNNHEQEVIMQYSTGYFMADIIVYLVPYLSSNDPLFILHHFTTSGYMMWSWKIGYGSISSLMLMFLGEATSVFFNPWLASREWLRVTGKKSVLAGIVFEIFTYPYSILFIVIRGIVAPWVLYDMCSKLLASDSLADETKYMWVTMITLAFMGSLIWVKKLVLGFGKHLYKRILGGGKPRAKTE